jgi:hypothetical protein
MTFSLLLSPAFEVGSQCPTADQMAEWVGRAKSRARMIEYKDPHSTRPKGEKDERRKEEKPVR